MADTGERSKKAAKPEQPLAPPDDSVWHRYSPHYEFPWSTISGISVHVLVFGLVFAYLKLHDSRSEAAKPLTVGAVVIAGGGGDPNGEGDGPGKPNPAEDTGEPTNTKSEINSKTGPVTKETLQTAAIDPLASAEFKGDDGRLLDDAAEATKRLAGQSEDLRKSLFTGLKQPKPGKGQGGTGSGGGKGKGKGTGEGDLSGAGKGNISVRQRRVLRWTMIFNTTDGRDYARQLAALNAILAVPSDRDGEYLVIRDLTRRPVTGKVEDLAQLNRIFWVDDQIGSVGPLAQALGMSAPPARVVAFFPVELEEKLLQLEKVHSGGKDEDQIKETRFRVRRVGRTYEPVVETTR